MTDIAPCLTVENEDQYKQAIQNIQPFAKRVHIDTSDGEFAPSFLLGADKLWWPQEWIVDIHAMVARPSEHAQALVGLKPSLLIFHAEVQEDLLPVMQYVKQNGVKAGVALKRSTVPRDVAPLIEAADHVMIFSGDLGYYGGVASMMQLEKIRLIKAINQSVEIGWDGGASIENAFSMAQGGVDVINVGSAIAEATEPQAAYQSIVNEINKKGVI